MPVDDPPISPALLAWPATAAELVAAQEILATARPTPWRPPATVTVAGCFACLPRGTVGRGAAGDPVWAAAAALRDRRRQGRAVARGDDDAGVVANAAANPSMPTIRMYRILEQAGL